MLRRLFVLAAALAMLVAYAIACGDPSHIFEGRLYVERRSCLGTTASVDVVEGAGGGNCGPTCLTQPHTDGGRAVYVATMCAPYPFGFDASGSDFACPAALAALERGDTCLLDGGSANPAPAEEPADAGGD
ncbi:MAG: hypothetical protein KF764_06170 [Labilithrix sp.]|nr:hypothetical protein [Labilithrix sp.]MBX3224025.1 hypothetical protein [Labilithrix sp.]